MSHMLGDVIIPIDPRTGKARKGKWGDRCWVPAVPEPIEPSPPTNPNFVWGDYGRNFYEKRAKKKVGGDGT